MDIRRFYVRGENITGNVAIIEGNEYYHVTKVMRYKKGYRLILCSGDGFDRLSEITEITADKVICKVLEIEKNERELKTKITLYQSMIRSERFDIAIQKAVELGVYKIVPIITERTMEKTFKRDRSERIIQEACKQCERAMLPEILDPISIDEAFKSARGDKLMAYENEEENHALKTLSNISEEVSLMIGPEGGFSDDEVNRARENGFITFSLGKRILKSETASIAAISAIAICTEGK